MEQGKIHEIGETGKTKHNLVLIFTHYSCVCVLCVSAQVSYGVQHIEICIAAIKTH